MACIKASVEEANKVKLKASLSLKNTFLDASIKRVNTPIEAVVTEVGSRLKATCSIVCTINYVPSEYWFWDDGVVILWDNGKEIIM